MQGVLGDERLAHSRVVVVTRRAVATHAEEDVLDLARAPLWGLVRSAQSEHPGRLALLDIDTLPVSEQAWQCALGSRGAAAGAAPGQALRAATGQGRDSELLVLRMTLPGRCRSRPGSLDTVLITGGTGTLGGLVARHLVARHGVRHLLLCSRAGGAEALQQELAAAGACVRVAACDVSDRGALSELLAGIDAEHPLTAVIHMAGVIDDGVFDAMGAERIDKVFAPKVDAAWHLHELTREQGACGIRAVFVGLWGAGGCRAGQLRGGQYVCSMRWRITGARKGCRRARWRGATGPSAAA